MSKILPKNAIKETFEWLAEVGVDEVILDTPQSRFEKKVDKSGAKITQDMAVPIKKVAMPKASIDLQALEKIQTLEDLRNYMQAFDHCGLKHTATNMVFSDGNSKAKVMIVGEAPGADEDRLGKPFVGMSGQLLDKALLSIGLSREKNIYISNIIPWRPPGNRPPTQEEIDICLPLIQKHIELIKPELLICVGGVSVKSLLKSKEAISKLRGTLHTYSIANQSVPLLATYHPAFLLRSPYRKRDVWLDLLLAKEKMIELGLAA
ncbi:MAG: uracil-DNA glycosylase [Rickettsiales bacterium]|nr:uracil-DNA glycosylase [Rickettsiales bacterium]|tara:strand:- start:13544 stop:14332 length:789 start_codon:yes stop_codon:yes gene_type:complete